MTFTPTDTAALPDSAIHWDKPGNQMPPNGYLFPLFPGVWLKNAPQAATVFSSLDTGLETGRFYLDVLRAAHNINLAVGQDLADLGAIVGLKKFAGETDDQFRVRIPATVRHGLSASSIPDMTAFLTAAIGVPVMVQDVAPGQFSVTLLQPIADTTHVHALINSVKSAGTNGTAQVVRNLAHVKAPVFGSFKFGTTSFGSNGFYLPIP